MCFFVRVCVCVFPAFRQCFAQKQEKMTEREREREEKNQTSNDGPRVDPDTHAHVKARAVVDDSHAVVDIQSELHHCFGVVVVPVEQATHPHEAVACRRLGELSVRFCASLKGGLKGGEQQNEKKRERERTRWTRTDGLDLLDPVKGGQLVKEGEKLVEEADQVRWGQARGEVGEAHHVDEHHGDGLVAIRDGMLPALQAVGNPPGENVEQQALLWWENG